MKIKAILWGIFYTVCLAGGTLLCCFADAIKCGWFNCMPMGIMLMVLGFFCWVFTYIEYLVDKIKNDKDKKD